MPGTILKFLLYIYSPFNFKRFCKYKDKILTLPTKMDKIFTIKERILYFIENQNIKKVDFFNNTGIASSNFKGEGKKSEIGGDKIVIILTVYPQLSAEWLLLGEGEMIKSKVNLKSVDSNLLLQRFEEVISENALLKRENSELKTLLKQNYGGKNPGILSDSEPT